jgi:Raf kinase inhibitor-like YbhB/YbcL family protein
MAFTIESPAFRDGERIPDRHARDGENLSPPLEWRDAPPGTRSFALVVEDPDAPMGMFRHWAVYDIDAARARLPEGATAGAGTEGLGHGVNDFGNAHYDGPQPPKRHGVHHYHFRLMALDAETLGLPPKASVEDVAAAARRHLLAEAELVGTFDNP